MKSMNLEQFTKKINSLIDQKQELPTLISGCRSLVGELVSDTEWLKELLSKLVLDKEFLNSQRDSVWPNEISLYRSPDKEFVVFGYIWEPYAIDTIHDHGSWGVIGSLINPFRERKYRRLDNGEIKGHAELEEVSAEIIKPGETTYVLPLNEGIHRIENTGDNIAISISVYGKAVRRGYVQFFDPKKKMVKRAFPSGALKRVLAIRTLGTIAEPWAEDILHASLRSQLPDFIQEECEASLSRFGRGQE